MTHFYGIIVTMKHIHVPLPDSAYDALRQQSKHTGQPATALVRQAVEVWLRDRRRAERAAALARYAAENGGTEVDLDPALEAASIESLLGADE
jgi:predicted DNA-binding protein